MIGSKKNDCSWKHRHKSISPRSLKRDSASNKAQNARNVADLRDSAPQNEKALGVSSQESPQSSNVHQNSLNNLVPGRRTGVHPKKTVKKQTDALARMKLRALKHYDVVDFDPLDMLVDIACSSVDKLLKMRAAKELAGYAYSRLQAVTHQVDGGMLGVIAVPVVVSKEDYIAGLKKVKELHADE